MAELSDQAKKAYWHFNLKLTIVLLSIWFVTTFILGGLAAGLLNQVTVAGFPLGYYMAAQGSIIVFVAEIAVYARVMNLKDRELGIRE